MIISQLQKTFGDEIGSFSNRQEVGPDVIDEANKRVIVPEKFRNDVEALEAYIDSSLTSGLSITVSLAELFCVCPRTRRKADAYNALIKFLRNEMNVTLTIKTSKSKEI